MNRRLAASAAAAGMLAGLVAVLLPQHATSAARVLSVAVAVVAGGLVLLAVAPQVAQVPPDTPLDRRTSHAVTPLDPHGLRDARRDLARPAAPGALPSGVRDRLTQAVRLRAHEIGLDLASERDAEAVRSLVGPDTWRAVAGASPPGPGIRSDPAAAAAVVHRILDDLDSLTSSPGGLHGNR